VKEEKAHYPTMKSPARRILDAVALQARAMYHPHIEKKNTLNR
jgi:hypothetical protein